MNGVIYCRVSSKEQVEGTSLDVQESACREYARAKDIGIIRVFIEQGESAKFADRTELLELIDFCREHKGTIHAIIVWKLDRFAREATDHFGIKAILAKYGVRIMSATEPIDTNPEGKLMETILAGFAQFDNDIRAMRTVQGMRRRIQEGIFPWGPPLGYKSSVVGVEKKTRPDLPDAPTFTLLQQAWKEFATGAYTQAEIGRLLQTRGLTGNDGRPFSPQTLSQLFKNPYYAGILRDPWGNEEHQGKHVPMVTCQEFARVQQIIGQRGCSVSHRKENPEFPLRGVVRCDSCLHTFTGAFSRGRSRRYPYYVCHGSYCPKRGKSHPVGEIHSEFDAILDRVSLKPDALLKLGEHIADAAGLRRRALASQHQRNEDQAAATDREVAELIRMRAQNLITDQEFLSQKRRMLEQRAASKSRDDGTVSVEELRQQLAEIVNPLADLRETWHTLQPSLRRRFDRIVLPVGFVRGASRTVQTGFMFSASEAFAQTDSLGVSFDSTKLNQVVAEIQALWGILKGIEEPKPERKTRFENSHRNRLRWRKSNQENDQAAA